MYQAFNLQGCNRCAKLISIWHAGMINWESPNQSVHSPCLLRNVAVLFVYWSLESVDIRPHQLLGSSGQSPNETASVNILLQFV